MLHSLLSSKIHRAQVTNVNLNYEGSLGIDSEVMDMVGILPYEKVLVGNIANGERFETYAFREPAGSKSITLNGATAHLGKAGDLLVILTFANFSPEEAKTWKPALLVLGDANQTILKLEKHEL